LPASIRRVRSPRLSAARRPPLATWCANRPLPGATSEVEGAGGTSAGDHAETACGGGAWGRVRVDRATVRQRQARGR
jgi:hypothetical protein